ncbi:MAG: hypoxanthine phosphoribosyltransferase [Actinobacteria bacterium]|nr:hypoxanthine phosphoribosyltransferase [Actinomycetota bacterium]
MPAVGPGSADQNATVVVGREELRAGVARLGAEIGADYPDGVVLVGVLKGCIPFLADLVRALTVPVEVDFLAISAYAEGTGRVRLVKDLDTDIADRDVVLVEDIVDTGLTLTYLLGELRHRDPRSLQACTLLDRTSQRIVPTPVRYVGFDVDDDYVVGYGLDHGERGRNLDMVVALDQGDADAYVESLLHG